MLALLGPKTVFLFLFFVLVVFLKNYADIRRVS